MAFAPYIGPNFSSSPSVLHFDALEWEVNKPKPKSTNRLSAIWSIAIYRLLTPAVDLLRWSGKWLKKNIKTNCMYWNLLVVFHLK